MTDSTPTTQTASVTTEGEAFTSAPQRLRYVAVDAPAPGTSVPVAPGVHWARIPLPLDLSHINVWLVEDGEGCVAVDTGLAADIGKQAWETIEREVFARRPLHAVFITHIHPDHFGLAAWLQQRFDVPVLMSARTHEIVQLMLAGASSGQAEAFLRSHGVDQPGDVQSIFKPERYARMVSGLPQVDRLVADGDVLRWGAAEWRALQTDGHAEGHLCLWSERHGALISGDQVLPTISSNISYSFHTADPNPLRSFLEALQRLRALPAETLVLPSHGVPFYGLQQRIDDLRRHHEEQLEKLAKLCVQPRLAAEMLPFLFRRQLKGVNLFLALGEALAHLEYLVQAGRMERQMTGGTIRYVTLTAG
jgi:glyoxylase-like metal-dependent hydrolase (beta-lactamase superfamily II)